MNTNLWRAAIAGAKLGASLAFIYILVYAIYESLFAFQYEETGMFPFLIFVGYGLLIGLLPATFMGFVTGAFFGIANSIYLTKLSATTLATVGFVTALGLSALLHLPYGLGWLDFGGVYITFLGIPTVIYLLAGALANMWLHPHVGDETVSIHLADSLFPLCVLIFVLLIWYSSASLFQVTEEIVMVSEGFEGPGVILYGRGEGSEPEYEGRSRVYHVPGNGIFVTQFERPRRGYRRRYFYSSLNGERVKIPYSPTCHPKVFDISAIVCDNFSLQMGEGMPRNNALFRIGPVDKNFDALYQKLQEELLTY